jgi:hypothetical protein
MPQQPVAPQKVARHFNPVPPFAQIRVIRGPLSASDFRVFRGSPSGRFALFRSTFRVFRVFRGHLSEVLRFPDFV